MSAYRCNRWPLPPFRYFADHFLLSVLKEKVVMIKGAQDG
jgi:hypothetical protein